MHTDITRVVKPKKLTWSQEFIRAFILQDITTLESRLAGLESDMRIDMLHGLTDAQDITRYYDAHVEHARLLERLSGAQDALRQLLA